MLLGVGGCGGKENNSGGGGAGGGFDAGLTEIVNPSATVGGALRLATANDADSWDPTRSYINAVYNLQRLYVRTLLTPAAAPGADGLALTPDLAEAQPDVSADGLTYTFRLRDGVRFEDGSAIRAQDVKYGIERLFAQETLSGGPTYLIEQLDQGQHYPGPYASKDGLKSVATPDDRTIVFHLAEPFADFPCLLAMGVAAPVPQSADTGEWYGDKPVSSGPYRFEPIDQGRKIAGGMLPPGIAGYDAGLDPYTTKSGKPQPDKARDELTRCGKADGFATVIATTNSPRAMKTAEAVQSSLAKVGINARIEPSDPSLYARSEVGSPSNVHAKGYGIILSAWSADFPTRLRLLPHAHRRAPDPAQRQQQLCRAGRSAHQPAAGPGPLDHGRHPRRRRVAADQRGGDGQRLDAAAHVRQGAQLPQPAPDQRIRQPLLRHLGRHGPGRRLSHPGRKPQPGARTAAQGLNPG